MACLMRPGEMKSVFIWLLACSGTLENEVEGECEGKLRPTVHGTTKFTLGLSINTTCVQEVEKGHFT